MDEAARLEDGGPGVDAGRRFRWRDHFGSQQIFTRVEPSPCW
jgi:hypothetical protein